MSDDGLLVGVAFLAIPLVLALYLLPAIIAFRRDHPNRWLILAVTLCLGSTGFGWAFALVWACGAAHRTARSDGTHGGKSGLNLFANDVQAVLLAGPAAPADERVQPRPRLSIGEAVREIERLERLRAAGHLGEVEFAALRADTLGRT